MTYFITFACYGCHLHGSESGSVDRYRNRPGTAMLPANASRHTADAARMAQPPYLLDKPRREAVLQACLEVCRYRQWTLCAAHIRTTHVHLVVEAGTSPERVMTDTKAYASRKLNDSGVDGPRRKRWARHGSTRYLWNRREISAAIQYVVEEQGAPMSVYQSEPRT